MLFLAWPLFFITIALNTSPIPHSWIRFLTDNKRHVVSLSGSFSMVRVSQARNLGIAHLELSENLKKLAHPGKEVVPKIWTVV